MRDKKHDHDRSSKSQTFPMFRNLVPESAKGAGYAPVAAGAVTLSLQVSSNDRPRGFITQFCWPLFPLSDFLSGQEITHLWSCINCQGRGAAGCGNSF